MFSTPATTRIARKTHRCTYCGETIRKGERYSYNTSVDTTWFANKMHLECAEDHKLSGESEYIPYNNERPTNDRNDYSSC